MLSEKMSSERLINLKYSIEYKESLLELLSLMWKDLNDAERKRRFEWWYEKIPYFYEPRIYIAVDNEKVVGFRGFIVQKFTNSQKTFNVLNPADIIVHPDYRRRGIFSKLNMLFLQDVLGARNQSNVILNLSSNRLSTPGYLKQGWRSD